MVELTERPRESFGSSVEVAVADEAVEGRREGASTVSSPVGLRLVQHARRDDPHDHVGEYDEDEEERGSPVRSQDEEKGEEGVEEDEAQGILPERTSQRQRLVVVPFQLTLIMCEG